MWTSIVYQRQREFTAMGFAWQVECCWLQGYKLALHACRKADQSAWAYLSKYRQMSSKFSRDEAECVTLDPENAEWRVVRGLNAVCVTTFGYELLKFILLRKTHIYMIPFLPVIQFTIYPPSLHASTLKQSYASQNTTITRYLQNILHYLTYVFCINHACRP